MSIPKNEEIKIRVPSPIKNAVQDLAHARYTSESEIVREAILQYLQRQPSVLRDKPSSNAPSGDPALTLLHGAATGGGETAKPKPAANTSYKAHGQTKKKRNAAPTSKT